MDYGEIRDLAKELNRPIGTLFVLDGYNDPFNIGSLRYERAEWFAQLWHSLHIPPGWHYRRIHYLLISQSNPVRMLADDQHLKGMSPTYVNTNVCWTYLGNAAKDAVHLGLVPLDAFVDRRNPE